MQRTKELPQLFKKTNTGAIQRWVIATVGTTIVTQFGQVGGKLQTTSDSIKAGKNTGRKNATDPEEQAEKEAQSQWTKKKKAGYVESYDDAVAGKTDKVIEGGVLPMLAKKYEDHQSKIQYPVMIQPKLDGHRCLAVIDKSGDVTLWTRTRKRITSVPHIEAKVKEVAKKMKLKNVTLDGELYSHKLKDAFEKLTSITRKKEATIDSVRIQYHIYDIISPLGFKARYNLLSNLVTLGGKVLEFVDTMECDNEFEVMIFYDRYKGQGYEGAMVRQLNRGYEGKRSDQLLKMKSFEDAEFEIIGIEEGRGKLQGHAGNFIVRDLIIGAKEFGVKLSGDTDRLKTIFENPKEYIGQMLTVKFQGRTADGIPRFPVGLRIRDDL